MIQSLADKRWWLLHPTTLIAGGIAVSACAIWTNLYLGAVHTLQGVEYDAEYWSLPCTIESIRFGVPTIAGSLLLRLLIGLWAVRLIRRRVRSERWLSALMLLPLSSQHPRPVGQACSHRKAWRT